MPKSEIYYRDAIEYNRALAKAAEDQAAALEDPEVREWCRSIGRQHRFHERQHKAVLAKIRANKTEVSEGEKPTVSEDEKKDSNNE